MTDAHFFYLMRQQLLLSGLAGLAMYFLPLWIMRRDFRPAARLLLILSPICLFFATASFWLGDRFAFTGILSASGVGIAVAAYQRHDKRRSGDDMA